MKHREISWILIPLICFSFIAKGFTEIKGNDLFKNGLFNIGFVVVQLVLLSVYVSIKNKKLTNIINTYLGIGDVLFFLAISTAFSPLNYVAFYLGSIMVTLIGFIFYKQLKKNANIEIPLAGSMAGVMMLVIAWSMVKPLYFYNDLTILNVFIQ